MKLRGKKTGWQAFTLVEILAVVVILFFIFAMVLPAGSPNKRNVYNAVCLSQQRQNVIGFILWSSDHGNQFPWEVSTNADSTRESCEAGDVSPSFHLLTNYSIPPKNFVCPSDKLKIVAPGLKTLTVSNVSYFIALDAGTNLASAIMTGDRHLAFNGAAANPGPVLWRASEKVEWTRELHDAKKIRSGVLSFRDGHCEITRSEKLNLVFTNQALPSQRLAVP